MISSTNRILCVAFQPVHYITPAASTRQINFALEPQGKTQASGVLYNMLNNCVEDLEGCGTLYASVLDALAVYHRKSSSMLG